MGITIEGPHKSIDMGYGGFAQLRLSCEKQLQN